MEVVFQESIIKQYGTIQHGVDLFIILPKWTYCICELNLIFDVNEQNYHQLKLYHHVQNHNNNLQHKQQAAAPST